MEPSPRVARSNQPSHFRAQRANTRVQRWLHVKQYGSRGYWRIWAFPSRNRFPFTAKTWAIFISLGTGVPHTHEAYRSALSLHLRACSGWRCQPSTHQHEPSNNQHLHQSPKSRQTSVVNEERGWLYKAPSYFVIRRPISFCNISIFLSVLIPLFIYLVFLSSPLL